MLRKRDRLDRDLIALLTEAARLSTSEIARRLGLARSTVNERIARLEQDGIILGYTAIVAPDLDQQETRSLLYLNCDRSRCRQIVQRLRGFPEIRECMSVSGPHDLLCMVHTPCAEDIDALIDEVMAVPGVMAVDTTVVLADKFDRRTETGGGRAGHLSLAS